MADKAKDKPDSKPSSPENISSNDKAEPHLPLPSTSTQSTPSPNTSSPPSDSPSSSLLWQKPASSSQSPKPTSSPATNTSTSTTATQPKRDLVSHASQFLSHPTISSSQDTQSKRAFLESKGLSADEINSILTSQSPISPSPAPSPSPSSTATAPIITYPEFALAPKPGPILSRTALLNIAYGTAALATGIVVGSTYILNPMLRQLTDARGEMYRFYGGKVNELNGKLEGVVSVVPAAPAGANEKDGQGQDNEKDKESEEGDGDPSELFHRDIATQTSSPSPPRSPSSPADSSRNTTTSTTTQSAKLQSLVRDLSSLKATTTSASETEQVALSNVLELSRSLDDMAYSLPSSLSSKSLLPFHSTSASRPPASATVSGMKPFERYDPEKAYAAYRASSAAGGAGGAPARKEPRDGYGYRPGAGQVQGDGQRDGSVNVDVDEMASMKAEIRSFKGLLLSARNFPRAQPTGTATAA